MPTAPTLQNPMGVNHLPAALASRRYTPRTYGLTARETAQERLRSSSPVSSIANQLHLDISIFEVLCLKILKAI